MWWIPVVIVLALLIVLIVANIKIVPQARAYVVERLGTYHATWNTGLHWKIPFVERVAKKISLMEQVADFQLQAVITFYRFRARQLKAFYLIGEVAHKCVKLAV